MSNPLERVVIVGCSLLGQCSRMSPNVLAAANQLGKGSCRLKRHTVRLESGDAAESSRELLVVDPGPGEDAEIGSYDEVLVAVETGTESSECTSEPTEFRSSSWVEAHIDGRVPPR